MGTDEDVDDEHIPPDKNEVMSQVRILSAKLADLSTCNDLITKQVIIDVSKKSTDTLISIL